MLERFRKLTTQSWWWPIALYGTMGATAGMFVGRATAPSPTLAVPAPSAASASATPGTTPPPSWDDARLDARFKRIEDRLDRETDRLDRHSDMIGDLNEKVNFHRHDKTGQTMVPPHGHGIEPGIQDGPVWKGPWPDMKKPCAPGPPFGGPGCENAKDGGPDARP